MTMRNNYRAVLFVACLSSGIVQAGASLVVQRKLENGTFQTLSEGTDYNVLAGDVVQLLQPSVDVPAGNTATLRVFRTNPSTEDLGRIDVTGLVKPEVIVLVGGNDVTSLSNSAPLSTPAARNWAGFRNDSGGGNYSILQARITGNLTGSIGTNQLRRLDADGQVQASVVSAPGIDSAPVFAIRAASFVSGINLDSRQSAMKEVTAISGDMNASVFGDADIELVTAPNGFIGGESAVLITSIGAGVGDVVAKSGVRANISAATGLKRLEVTDTSSTFGARGTINTPTLLNRSATQGGLIRVPGFYRMVTTLTNGLPANAVIQLARLGEETGNSGTTDLNQPLIILGNHGANDLRLSGQIVLNAFNNVTPESNGTSRAWVGRINVRKPGGVTTSLGPTTASYLNSFNGEYAETGADLGQSSGSGAGQGAAGLAAYFVHGTDSTLAFTLSGNTRTFTEAAPNATVKKAYRSGAESATWTVRFYGPTTPRDDNSPDPVVIERRGCGVTA